VVSNHFSTLGRKVFVIIRRAICFYSVATNLGGAELSLLELLRELRSNEGIVSWVLVPKSKGPLLDQLKKYEIPYVVLPMPKFFFRMSRGTPLKSLLFFFISAPVLPIYLVRCINIIRKHNTALIYSTGIKCHALAAIMTLPSSCKLI